MRGLMRSLVALSAAVALAACGSEAGVESTVPPAATPEQVDVFCERLDEVRDQEIGAMFEALLDVAPPELAAPLARLSGPPTDGYWDDRDQVEKFMQRCET